MRSMGIDGQANNTGRRMASPAEANPGVGAVVSHPARGPVRSMGIDGQASNTGRRMAFPAEASQGAGAVVSHPARGPVRRCDLSGGMPYFLKAVA